MSEAIPVVQALDNAEEILSGLCGLLAAKAPNQDLVLSDREVAGVTLILEQVREIIRRSMAS